MEERSRSLHIYMLYVPVVQIHKSAKSELVFCEFPLVGPLVLSVDVSLVIILMYHTPPPPIIGRVGV